jgi:glutathione S-transferase
MYAPVVHRFLNFAIDVTPDARSYMEAMQALPAFRQWTEEALAETLVIPRLEQE